MNKQTIIEVNGVSKKFCKNARRMLQYGLIDIGKGMCGRFNSGTLRQDEFWALKNISFKIKKGETLGIVGANGSGKSTLLRLLDGIFLPDKGEVRSRGKISSLIAVGSGFHPLLTGRENIYVNGSILQMSKKEIDRKFADIVAFADIADFLDTPVKNYSSGMYVRLGFAIAIHADFDILLVDEILSVGDVEFRRKSIQKMREIAKSKRNIIFVSHNIGAIKTFAQKTIYLKNGSIAARGETAKVLSQYLHDKEKD